MEVPPKLERGDPGYNPMLDELRGMGRNIPDYTDRAGRPITLRQFGQLHEMREYVVIAEDRLDEGVIWISTVWLGLDHNWALGPPLTFETMVFVRCTDEQLEERRRRWRMVNFAPDDFPWEDLQRVRWSTEDEARDGHRNVVDSLRLKIEIMEEHLLE